MFYFSRLLWVVLVFMLIEAAVLATQPRDRQKRVYPTLVAGIGLVVSWQITRSSLPPWIALAPLAAAFGAHVLDLWRRWPRSP
jgi:hypothetical protein